jgi:mannose-6-phosphate isomerase-like protein (cupin superfamily)
LVEGQDILIIGVGDGELANETKSPPTYIDVRNGAVVLMPKEEPYRWRNVGKQDVELLAVDVRR